jgi:hypothetical protein
VQKTSTVGVLGRGVCSILSSKCSDGSLIVATDGEHLTCDGFTLGETVRFGRLEFISDCFDSLILSPKGNDSDTFFVGTGRSGSPLL